MARFPQESAGSQEYLDAAEEHMGDIRDLAKKPEQRYFGIGPKKSLSSADKQLQGQLSQNYQKLYAKGMQKRRLEKGVTRMVGGKEVNR